ncbi:MAG: spermidine/putrescine transporter ATP-binding protein [Gemmatimonadetes bacterium]|nr:spermidine/putrescine transporter ATP-binding protein [Gemmatimonadota bacterium]
MLTLENLSRRFGGTVAVDGLSLRVDRGEIVTLLGPSGCGKTTTLRMIAGFEAPTEGRILLEGRDVTALTPQKRGMGMVFQSYALFPHLDVRQNVEFGLRSRGDRGADAAAAAERALNLVELAGYADRRVQALSGGQQQRVALARALAPEPPVLLLDEPLSNLDAALRERTRDELRTLLKRLGMTAVFVTHDQEEAFALSDRIGVLSRGRLQQAGTPEELYSSPSNAFVAGFLGRANFLPAKVLGMDGGELVCELPGGTRWRARPSGSADPGASADTTALVDSAAGTDVRLMLRPEGLRFGGGAADDEAAGAGLGGRVIDRRFAGAASFYRVQTAAGEVLVQGGPADAAAGEEVRILPTDGTSAAAFPPEDA